MNQLFITIISTSVSGSMVFMLIYMVRLAFKRSLSQTWRYFIWVAVLIRMLIPFSPDNSIVGKVFSTIDTTSLSAGTELVSNYSDDTEPVIVENIVEQTNDNVPVKSNIVFLDLLHVFINYIGYLWLFVLLALLIQKVAKYYRFIKFIKANRFTVTDEGTLKTYIQTYSTMGISCPPRLYVSKAVVTPLLVGIIKPFIVLPATSFMEQQLSFVFRHELTHFKRHDLLYKWMAQITLCIHWFNPLIYIAANEIDKDCELSCDENVIKDMSLQEKKSYGDTLIVSLKNPTYSFKSVAVAIMSENITDLKERLVSIMKNPSRTKASAILSLSLTTLILVSVFYSGAYAGAVEHNELSNNSSTAQIVNKLTETNDLTNDESQKSEDFYSQMNLNGTFTSNFADYVNNYIVSVSVTNSPVKTGDVEITVGDNESKKGMWFTEETKAQASDKAVLDAVLKITQNKSYRMPEEATGWRYVITSISGPYSETPDELVEKFYNDNSITLFSAVCRYTSSSKKTEFLNKAYDDNKISYFAVLLNSADNTDYGHFILKALNDDKISFFSILLNKSDNIDYDDIAIKAYNSSRTSFIAVLSNYMSDSTKMQILDKSYNDSKIDIFSLLLNNIDGIDYDAYALKAYNSSRISFIAVLSNYMSDSAKTELLNKAKKDGKISFVSVLS